MTHSQPSATSDGESFDRLHPHERRAHFSALPRHAPAQCELGAEIAKRAESGSRSAEAREFSAVGQAHRPPTNYRGQDDCERIRHYAQSSTSSSRKSSWLSKKTMRSERAQ